MNKTCKDLKKENPELEEDIYTINLASKSSRTVYYDMTTDGGGWMLLDNFVSSLIGDIDPYDTDYNIHIGVIESVGQTRKRLSSNVLFRKSIWIH